jgi:hypothetical protein
MRRQAEPHRETFLACCACGVYPPGSTVWHNLTTAARVDVRWSPTCPWEVPSSISSFLPTASPHRRRSSEPDRVTVGFVGYVLDSLGADGGGDRVTSILLSLSYNLIGYAWNSTFTCADGGTGQNPNRPALATAGAPLLAALTREQKVTYYQRHGRSVQSPGRPDASQPPR